MSQIIFLHIWKLYFTSGTIICKIRLNDKPVFLVKAIKRRMGKEATCMVIGGADRGLLWEHLVLDMLRVAYGVVYYWTDKNKNEVDFIVKGDRGEVHIIECKINPDKYSSAAVKRFREYYPKGRNYCFSPHIKTPYKLRFGIIEVIFQSAI